MDFAKDLEILYRSRFTLMIVITPEESRAMKAMQKMCDGLGIGCVSWDIADGFKVLSGTAAGLTSNNGGPKEPIGALTEIEKVTGRALFVLKDFHELWKNAQVKRKLRNLAYALPSKGVSLVVVTPCNEIPPELKDDAQVMDYPLPREDELDEVLKEVGTHPKVQIKLNELQRQKLLQAALGLTWSQAKRVFFKAATQNAGVLSDEHIKLVTEEKRQVIRGSEALEFYPVSETMNDVGGLDVLKEWLKIRERAFTKKAAAHGVETPKGVGLIGVPGTGKSLTAKTIASVWRMPLLRLDTGALYGSLVGESEARTKAALQVADTIAPCVLWIDEMEKAFAHGGLDSGTSTRVFGQILTWMQEKTTPVFVVATANDIGALPPELMRKGRFDEIFFLDLPSTEERKEIFSVLLHRKKLLPEKFDLNALANETEYFVGAEIEQAIKDAITFAFSDGERPVTTKDIQAQIRKLVPLVKSQPERLKELRKWLEDGKAVSASYKESEVALKKALPVDLWIEGQD